MIAQLCLRMYSISQSVGLGALPGYSQSVVALAMLACLRPPSPCAILSDLDRKRPRKFSPCQIQDEADATVPGCALQRVISQSMNDRKLPSRGPFFTGKQG